MSQFSIETNIKTLILISYFTLSTRIKLPLFSISAAASFTVFFSIFFNITLILQKVFTFLRRFYVGVNEVMIYFKDTF